MMFQRQKPIPMVQAGGMQPYHGSTPQMPGMALTAMLAGRTSQGYNPQDIVRQTQRGGRARMADRRAQSLLGTLLT